MKPRTWAETQAAVKAGDGESIDFLVSIAEMYTRYLTRGNTTEMELYQDGLGAAVFVHKEKEDCANGCCVHHPSDHHMRDWPTIWRNDRGLMERVCEHGVGHPDPDAISHIRKTDGIASAVAESTHGCDGCCHAS